MKIINAKYIGLLVVLLGVASCNDPEDYDRTEIVPNCRNYHRVRQISPPMFPWGTL